MTYKQYITRMCTRYGKDPLTRFIGYNTVRGSRMYGTLNGVKKSRCIEAPVAENLMMGLAMGMSLEGFKPVVCFERHDFMLLAMDALVNHMDKMPWLSGGQFKYPIIVRAIIGGNKPIKPGPQHTQNYFQELRTMLKHTPVYFPLWKGAMDSAWDAAGKSESGAVVIVERRDYYEEAIG